MTLPKNHLPEFFYTIPDNAKTTMKYKELQDTLIATNGWIFACGSFYNIKSKPIGAGVHLVTLRKGLLNLRDDNDNNL